MPDGARSLKHRQILHCCKLSQLLFFKAIVFYKRMIPVKELCITCILCSAEIRMSPVHPKNKGPIGYLYGLTRCIVLETENCVVSDSGFFPQLLPLSSSVLRDDRTDGLRPQQSHGRTPMDGLLGVLEPAKGAWEQRVRSTRTAACRTDSGTLEM